MWAPEAVGLLTRPMRRPQSTKNSELRITTPPQKFFLFADAASAKRRDAAYRPPAMDYATFVIASHRDLTMLAVFG
jgi:hypothetical protein